MSIFMFPNSVVEIALKEYNYCIDTLGYDNANAFKHAFNKALTEVPIYDEEGILLDNDRLILQLRLNVVKLHEKLDRLTKKPPVDLEFKLESYS